MSGLLLLNQPSKKVVLDSINGQNNTTLTFDDIDLSAPIDVTDQQIGVNTVVTAISKEGSIYYGNVIMEYSRIDLGSLSESVILVDGHVHEHDHVISLLNTAAGLALTPDEIESVSIDEDGFLQLKALDSYLYLPNTTLSVRDEFDHWLGAFHVSVTDMITGLR